MEKSLILIFSQILGTFTRSEDCVRGQNRGATEMRVVVGIIPN